MGKMGSRMWDSRILLPVISVRKGSGLSLEGMIMKHSLLAKRTAAAAFSAVLSMTAATGTFTGTFITDLSDTALTAVAAESSVKVLSAVGYGEGMYATWSSVSGAGGYNVYVDGFQIDTMLVRQYNG